MKHLVAAGAIALASPAVAQPLCMGYPDLTTMLTTELSQSLASRGVMLHPGHGVAEVWVNKETRSWTLLVMGPSGVACVVSLGTDWETPLPGQPS